MPQSYFVKSKEKHLEFTKHIYVKYSMPLIYCCCHLLRIICFQEEEMNQMWVTAGWLYNKIWVVLFIYFNQCKRWTKTQKWSNSKDTLNMEMGDVRWTHTRHENRDQEPGTELKMQFLHHVLDLPRGLC